MTPAQRRERLFPDLLTSGDLGRAIKLLRSEVGLTQTALADAMADTGGFFWHPSTVSKVESGDRDCSVAELVALSTVLGASPEDILSMARSSRLDPWDFDVAKRREHAEQVLAEAHDLSVAADQMQQDLTQTLAEQDLARKEREKEIHAMRQRAHAAADEPRTCSARCR